jgi:four helix bundle protein
MLPRQDLSTRTRQFALRIIRLYGALPNSVEGQVLGKQVLRSGTSVGAQYREALRARSTAEYISKVESGLQELEETGYWLGLLAESQIVPPRRLTELQRETDELTAILVSCVKTAKGNGRGSRSRTRKPDRSDSVLRPPSSVL